MSIAIIETGPVPETLIGTYGDYPKMVRDWLEPHFPPEAFRTISPINGESLGDVDDHDAYVITGSKYGVYDDVPWMTPLLDFVQQAWSRRKAMFGICFGHQVMAHALGGLAAKHPSGWVCGHETYSVDGASLYGGPTLHMSGLAIHQDQVERLPTGVSRVGGNGACRYAILEYAGPFASVQFHPEFSCSYFRDLIAARRGSAIPDDVAARALESMPENVEARDEAVFAARVLGNGV